MGTWESLDVRTKVFVIKPLFEMIITTVGEGYDGNLLTLIQEDREVHREVYELHEVNLTNEEIAALFPEYLDNLRTDYQGAIESEEARAKRLEQGLLHLHDSIQTLKLFLAKIKETQGWLERQ